MNINTKQKGILTEERCKLFFIERGLTVSVPIGDNAKYDLIVDTGTKLLRLQVKTSHSNDNGSTFSFEATSNVVNRRTILTKKYNKEDIDGFCTWFDGKVYIIPWKDTSQVTLRLTDPLNNNAKNIKWASDYEADKIISKLNSM